MKNRYLAVEAHPDDMEFRMGGTLAKLCRDGHEVKILSLTTGNAGHHSMDPESLAGRRRAETAAVARTAGLAAYEIWGIPDGYLEATMENRLRLIRDMRAFDPDVVFSLRTQDYHPDHRAAAQLVQDAAYLITVPLYCPDAPAPAAAPLILNVYDDFTMPCPFRADVAVVVDDVAETKLELMACHESQYFEWLPYSMGQLDEVPEDPAERLEWIKGIWMAPDAVQAESFRTLLEKRYGNEAAHAVYAETFELSEYGRIPDNLDDELNRLLPL
jgi:LmbE family N-acetylglucosaminyl deacetylase